MAWEPQRDFIGYGAAPPNPCWPGGAVLAVNFVLNVEEGSEPVIAHQGGERGLRAGSGYESRYG